MLIMSGIYVPAPPAPHQMKINGGAFVDRFFPLHLKQQN